MDHGGPSVTARRVAAHRLGFSRVPAPYGDPAADEALAADVAAGQPPSSGRMRDYLAGRTRFFDQVVVSAIGRGMRQIVIGAAGYDGRALRYAGSGVRWFEVDLPATQRDKRERLERLGLAARQVRFVEADFTRDPVAERLLQAGLDPAQPSLFLLEGIAVYLEVAVLETVLSQFRQVAAAGSRLAISVGLSGAHTEARSRFAESVAALGEPARSALGADEAAELLAGAGWRITAAGDPDDPEAAARRERRRSAGLLTARAASPIHAPSAADAPSATDPSSATRAGRALRASSQPDRPPAAETPASQLPLSALLSQALVAFTIEVDNEAEHRIPHWTSNFGASRQDDGAWLVSLVMWENCMRFVADQPITVRELQTLARTGTNLDGMRRWGYITIDGTARKIHHGRPGPQAVLRATATGLRTRQTWLPLPGVIEARWRERFGADHVDRLRDALLAVVSRLDPGLPDCLPILNQALVSQGPDPALPPRPEPVDLAALPLSALLSRMLLSFAIEYEREAEPALAVSANVLRVLGAEGTRLRDLPVLTGTSKEAVRWALGLLRRARLAVAEPDPAGRRGQVVRLTPGGVSAQCGYHELARTIEQQWRERFTGDTISALRQVLGSLAAGSDGRPPPLFRGLEPYPGNWRARVRPPIVLPHFPMVLHRGGYPDGS
jgi:methyltransferase (TIGR00027 family)